MSAHLAAFAAPAQASLGCGWGLVCFGWQLGLGILGIPSRSAISGRASFLCSATSATIQRARLTHNPQSPKQLYLPRIKVHTYCTCTMGAEFHLHHHEISTNNKLSLSAVSQAHSSPRTIHLPSAHHRLSDLSRCCHSTHTKTSCPSNQSQSHLRSTNFLSL